MKKSSIKYLIIIVTLLEVSLLIISCAPTHLPLDSVKYNLESAVMTINAAINANNYFRTDYDQDALSFVMLEKMDYLMIDPYTKEIFTFELILEDGRLKSIVATTTQDSPLGEGKKVIYNMTTKVWSGDLVESCKTRD